MTVDDIRLTARATDRPPVTPPPTLASIAIRTLVEALAKLGYDTSALRSSAGLSRTDLDDPDARVDCSAYGRLVQAAVQMRPLPNLALKLAAVTPIGAYPLLDYLVLTCDTVGQGVTQLARFFRLLEDPQTIAVHADEYPVRVLLDNRGFSFSVEYTASLTTLHLRHETAGRFTPDGICFMHHPDDAADMSRVLRCPVSGGEAWNGLLVSADMWRLPLERRDPILHGVLEHHAAQLPVPRPPDGVVAELRQLIAAGLAQGDTRIQAMARRLSTTPRTLQRRLAAESLTYQDVLESTRRELAERHLSEPRLSIAEVSYLLGYSEPAAFHRAFKRWRGQTPHAYRQQARSA